MRIKFTPQLLGVKVDVKISPSYVVISWVNLVEQVHATYIASKFTNILYYITGVLRHSNYKIVHLR